jgi:hypothetical protein
MIVQKVGQLRHKPVLHVRPVMLQQGQYVVGEDVGVGVGEGVQVGQQELF